MKRRLELMKKLALWLCVLTLLVFLAGCGGEKVLEPSERFYVYDSTGTLSAHTQSHIAERSTAFYKETGVKVVFVVVRETDGRRTADYARAIAKQWDLEKEGFLFLAVLDDGDYCFLNGTETEKRFPSASACTVVGQVFEPYFMETIYDDGIYLFYDSLLDRMEEAYGVSEGGKGSAIFKGVLLVVTLIAVILVLYFVFGGTRNSRPSGGYRPPRGGYRPPSGGYRPPSGYRPNPPRPMGGSRPMGGGYRPPMSGSRPTGAPRPMSGSRPMSGGSMGSRPTNGSFGGGSTRGGGAGRR